MIYVHESYYNTLLNVDDSNHSYQYLRHLDDKQNQFMFFALMDGKFCHAESKNLHMNSSNVLSTTTKSFKELNLQ